MYKIAILVAFFISFISDRRLFPVGSQLVIGLFPQYANMLVPRMPWPVEARPSALMNLLIEGA